MKKIILLIVLTIPSLFINSQSLYIENQYPDSMVKSGKLTSAQADQLRKKWNAFIAGYTYPELAVNRSTGEIDITDILTFPNLDKLTLYQRCLQWIAINYGDLIHNDLQSGKIIANGFLNLSHYSDVRVGFGSRETQQTQTPTSYSMILTFKDGKIKYTITNITFTFSRVDAATESVIESSVPIASLYPIIAQDQTQWKTYVTLLNEAKSRFYIKLKSALTDYVKDVENDYNF
jgi:hypothetical protein